MKYLLLAALYLLGCGEDLSTVCIDLEKSIHADLSEAFSKARRCEVATDISQQETSCGCDHTKPYGGVKLIQTISCGAVTTVEEAYPYYGLRFRYREGKLEFVGGKEAGILASFYKTVWDSTYNGCQTKTFMYCL